MPPTNTSSVCFISLKVGRGAAFDTGRGVVSVEQRAGTIGLAAVEGAFCLFLMGAGGPATISTTVAVAVALSVEVEVEVEVDAAWVVTLAFTSRGLRRPWP